MLKYSRIIKSFGVENVEKIDPNNLPDGKVFVCKNGELLTGEI